MNDSLHRVVFTTDFGNKLLDFEISDKACKVNYIVEALNRKIIINTLKNDFRLLLKSNYEIQEVFENETDLIYKAQDHKGYTYFFESKKDNNLIKLLHTSKTKEKVTFEFNSKNSTFAENIIITHHSIKLKLEFNQINN